MNVSEVGTLFLAGLAGGALNAAAGGGILLTLPVLLVGGMSSIAANATSTVALWPGSLASIGAYREELRHQHRPLLIALGLVSLVGGSLGALLLLHTSQEVFSHLVPYLLLTATLLFTFGRPINSWLRRRKGDEPAGTPPAGVLATISTVQFAISVYGGYFGGGSILMLASLGFLESRNIHMLNALRSLLVVCVTGAAVISLTVAGAVLWPQTIAITLGAIAGGYAGARWVRRADPEVMRWFVILVGICITAYFFKRR